MKKIVAFFLLNTAVVASACSNNSSASSENEAYKTTLNSVKDTLTFRSGIRCLIQDRKGNYWIGSDQEGLCKFDGERFTYFAQEHGLYGLQITDIQEEIDGTIWVNTSRGLHSYDGKGFKYHKTEIPIGSLSNYWNEKWTADRGELWFATNQPSELIRIVHGTIHTVHYPISYNSSVYGPDYGTTGISKSKKGGLWIANYQGISYYDGFQAKYINDSTMHYDGKTKYMHVRSILEDSKGRVWIGNNGIGVLLMHNDSVIHFSEQLKVTKGAYFGQKSPPGTLMHVFAISEDSKGNIWFGDRDTGVWRFDGKELKNFLPDTALRSHHIWNITEDNSGNLLVASGDRGVYKFNGTGFDRFF